MTMKGKTILLAALLAILPSSIDAQKKKSAPKAKAKQKATVVDKEFELRLESMRGATQKVMFIDSIVVNKSRLLSSLNIPDEAGGIHPYNNFFNTSDQPNSIVYVNQLKNRCVFSKFADGGWDLYSSEMIGGKWSHAVPLKGLDVLGDDVDINWPFMLSDGTTLYFAAKGEESIGGFDIFMTRYDETTQSYLKPENIGMPFNSIGNDYFYIVDEYDGIGWFATDRNQPEGKVCSVAAVRRTGGSGAGRVSAVGLVARSHQGATLQCGGETVRHCGGSEAGCFCGACCEIVKGYKKGCVRGHSLY